MTLNKTVFGSFLFWVGFILPACARQIPPAGPNVVQAQRLPTASDEASGNKSKANAAPMQRYLEYRYYDSAEDALLDVVATTRPRVIGFGEYHSQTGHLIESALHRFTTSLLPAISSVTSDIIVEALVTEGQCQALTEEVLQTVQQDTHRAETTEDETVTLFQTARQRGVFPHFLTLSCEDHRQVYGSDQIDYDRLLQLIGRRTGEKIESVMDFRASAHRKSKPLIAVYSGAIHNDADPDPSWDRYAFGPSILTRLPRNKYVEIDLVVPAIVENIDFVRDAEWYPLFKDKTDKNCTLLIKRSDRNYIIVFPRASGAPCIVQ
ncbi:MAG: hypothetical protein JXR76_08275 [Deltaproteobacteria bacterium]|nr:hypothetical protein [Deltaproteobacteria bacterium]